MSVDNPKVRQCALETCDEDNLPCIHSSDRPLIDRKSVFVAHAARVQNITQVKGVISKLMKNKKTAKATHNIMAYRIVMPDGFVLQGCDDDGETAAGGRLLDLIQLMKVQNIVIVVSRWFGGTRLGADRFRDINKCAKQLLEEAKLDKIKPVDDNKSRREHKRRDCAFHGGYEMVKSFHNLGNELHRLHSALKDNVGLNGCYKEPE
ncbi:hypothetical protein EC973_007314 [Apophysomyces ossiformis]|uniref:Impact N-terminal domain-containing protein n=1 Tax=Apophysomyces ossiformis TaxID=679940 RepID=A0A8H7BXZ8_9FUNG|nr:hypothetical protein EC973_007314 [Apophysomyces ossiformis]